MVLYFYCTFQCITGPWSQLQWRICWEISEKLRKMQFISGYVIIFSGQLNLRNSNFIFRFGSTLIDEAKSIPNSHDGWFTGPGKTPLSQNQSVRKYERVEKQALICSYKTMKVILVLSDVAYSIFHFFSINWGFPLSIVTTYPSWLPSSLKCVQYHGNKGLHS